MWLEKLLPEQTEAYQFILNKLRNGGGAGLISEQGTGKTIISLALLEELKFNTILIVCPLTAKELTWASRLRSTLPDYALLLSWEDFKLSASRRRVLLIHTQLMTKLAKKLALQAWDIVIIDEAHALKARNSAQSRAARQLRNAKRRLILSGTPIDKSPIDIYAQMRFVDHTVLGENWGNFADEWCRKGGFQGKQWIFRPQRLPAFLKLLETHLCRLSLDSFNIPYPKIHLIPVEMLGRQARIYTEMDTESLITLNGHVIKADLPITKKIKLEQITGGFVKDDESGDEIDLGRAKERKLRWLIKKLKPPLVVTGKFLHDIEVIYKVLRERFKRVGVLTGEIKKDDRTQIVADFQAGRLDAVVVQVRTGGVSIELSHAYQLVIYSMNHSRIDFDQMIARLRRLGQKRQVEIFLLLAQNSVDEGIRIIVEQKCRDAYLIESHFEGR